MPTFEYPMEMAVMGAVVTDAVVIGVINSPLLTCPCPMPLSENTDYKSRKFTVIYSE